MCPVNAEGMANSVDLYEAEQSDLGLCYSGTDKEGIW